MQDTPIWETARIDILDAIPENIENNFKNSLSFYEWREKGGYHVTGATKNDFYLSCAYKEYGSMLAKEVDYLIEQALEHRLIIDSEIKGKLKSPTWTMVTIYYWCLFSSIAWLRLHGKIVTYLPSEETDRFKKLCSYGSKFPSNGTFLFQRSNTDLSVTGSRIEILCRKLKTNNFHEGLWNQFHLEIKSKINPKSQANLETRIYSSLSFDGYLDGYSWPSVLRNTINYKIGVGYKAIDGNMNINLESLLKSIKDYSIADIVTEMENLKFEIARTTVINSIEKYSELMILFGTLISRLLVDYRDSIWEHRKIKLLRTHEREKYLNDFGFTMSELWPK